MYESTTKNIVHLANSTKNKNNFKLHQIWVLKNCMISIAIILFTECYLKKNIM